MLNHVQGQNVSKTFVFVVSVFSHFDKKQLAHNRKQGASASPSLNHSFYQYLIYAKCRNEEELKEKRSSENGEDFTHAEWKER